MRFWEPHKYFEMCSRCSSKLWEGWRYILLATLLSQCKGFEFKFHKNSMEIKNLFHKSQKITFFAFKIHSRQKKKLFLSFLHISSPFCRVFWYSRIYKKNYIHGKEVRKAQLQQLLLLMFPISFIVNAKQCLY